MECEPEKERGLVTEHDAHLPVPNSSLGQVPAHLLPGLGEGAATLPLMVAYKGAELAGCGYAAATSPMR